MIFLIIFSAVLFVLYAYVGLRFVMPLEIMSSSKYVLCFILFDIYCFPFIGILLNFYNIENFPKTWGLGRVFGPQMPKYGKSRSQSPKYLQLFQSYKSFRIDLSIRFQRALNEFSIYLQTRIMHIFVFLGPKPQIWKFGPRTPNF